MTTKEKILKEFDDLWDIYLEETSRDSIKKFLSQSLDQIHNSAIEDCLKRVKAMPYSEECAKLVERYLSLDIEIFGKDYGEFL